VIEAAQAAAAAPTAGFPFLAQRDAALYSRHLPHAARYSPLFRTFSAQARGLAQCSVFHLAAARLSSLLTPVSIFQYLASKIVNIALHPSESVGKRGLARVSAH